MAFKNTLPYFVAIMFICCYSQIYTTCHAANLFLSEADIVKIEVYGGGGNAALEPEYNMLTFSTDKRNEITYITNYINSFHLLYDSKEVFPNDTAQYTIRLTNLDGSNSNYHYFSGRFQDGEKQYSLEGNTFYAFLDTINAIKFNLKIIDKNIDFKPSDWAIDIVNKAVGKNLLPKVNQIGYRSYIDRIESVQLIYTLMKNNNIINSHSLENLRFSDTNDISANYLYSNMIISGKYNDFFVPYAYITREEFATILYNVISSSVNDNVYLTVDDEFNDSHTIAGYAIKPINFMLANNIMVGDNNSCFRPKDYITKEEVVAVILSVDDFLKM